MHNVESRAANVCAGYVYAISNIGAFGDRMVKIDITGRLNSWSRCHRVGQAGLHNRAPDELASVQYEHLHVVSVLRTVPGSAPSSMSARRSHSNALPLPAA